MEEKDSFYWPKMHLWKSDNNFWQDPSPPSPHLDKIQKNCYFFLETFPKSQVPARGRAKSSRTQLKCNKYIEHGKPWFMGLKNVATVAKYKLYLFPFCGVLFRPLKVEIHWSKIAFTQCRSLILNNCMYALTEHLSLKLTADFFLNQLWTNCGPVVDQVWTNYRPIVDQLWTGRSRIRMLRWWICRPYTSHTWIRMVCK